MGRKYNYDYIIIGSGPAGSAAALSLAKAKKRIALVEGRFFGGSHLNTRDVPYSAALNFSHNYYELSTHPALSHQDFSFSFPSLVSHQLHTIINAGGNDTSEFESAGITCIRGYANFLDNNTIAVDDKQYTANNFIIATGAHTNITGVNGTDRVNYLTPTTAIRIRRLPKAVMVIGGGSTGCEIAEYFAKLGTKVLITEMSSRLLPREDIEASQTISDHLANDLGVVVLPNCKVVALEQDNASKRVIFQNNNTEKMVRVDCIVFATGSAPNLDMGLENANVKYTNAGIKIDKYFCTSAKNIYAIGDCTCSDSSTTRANYEGRLLAANLIDKVKNAPNYKGLARITNTSPAIATIGLSEDDLLSRDRKYKKSIIYLSDTTAGKIANLNYGFVKLLANRSNHIIGGCIIAPNADLMANEISLAIRNNLTALEIASTPHVADNFSYAIQLAAKQLATQKK